MSRWLLLLLLAIAGTPWLSQAFQPPASTPPATTTLAVAGRSNQTPWVAASGTAVAVVWGAQASGGGSDVFAAISRDGGRTFGLPVRVNAEPGEGRLGGELPPRVAFAAGSGRDPAIVVAYGAKTPTGTAIKVTWSMDGGRTYAVPRSLQLDGAAGDRGWHALTVDGTGTAHVMWLDHRGLADRRPTEAEALDGAGVAQRSGLYYARVPVAGRSEPSAVDRMSPAGERELLKGVCYCCKVALATGSRGELLAAWRHVFPGNIRDVAFLTSTDGGVSFGAPGRVSVDNWHLAGCPDDGPAMAVDEAGIAHVVWPTVLGTGDAAAGAIFHASSSDGRTFTRRTQVPTLGGSRPMHPQIAVDPARRELIVAWDEVVGGTRRAALRRMRLDSSDQPLFGDAVRLGSPDSPSSYPVVVMAGGGPLAVFVDGPAGTAVVKAVPVDAPAATARPAVP